VGLPPQQARVTRAPRLRRASPQGPCATPCETSDFAKAEGFKPSLEGNHGWFHQARLINR
jgi:hypothetical protein